jgi:hypothetical protein
MQRFRLAAEHELGKAELAVIVIVIRVRRSVPPPDQHGPAEIPLLIGKTPVLWVAHAGGLTKEGEGSEQAGERACEASLSTDGLGITGVL